MSAPMRGNVVLLDKAENRGHDKVKKVCAHNSTPSVCGLWCCTCRTDDVTMWVSPGHVRDMSSPNSSPSPGNPCTSPLPAQSLWNNMGRKMHPVLCDCEQIDLTGRWLMREGLQPSHKGSLKVSNAQWLLCWSNPDELKPFEMDFRKFHFHVKTWCILLAFLLEYCGGQAKFSMWIYSFIKRDEELRKTYLEGGSFLGVHLHS